MKLNHYSAEKLKTELRDIFSKYLDLTKYKVFIFGSRVTGTAHERSDIDIGILGPEKVPQHILAQIREEADNLPLLYKFDIVDFATVDEKFKEEALKAIEEI